MIGNDKAKVVLKMRKQLPRYYKLPSETFSGTMIKLPTAPQLKTKLEWEKAKDFSLSLTAAFAFADSLTHGACGHKPISLDLTSWNILIKVCCYKGAIIRALEIVNDKLPRNGLKANSFTYNTILAGLARVGDRDFMREVLIKMTNSTISPNKCTVQALVDGYLNVGDIGGAATIVQDIFNQHNILPPYTSHLKIIEFALASNQIYEAKRHVYFIQQLYKWEPTKNDPQSLTVFMNMTKKNPKLSKEALKKLFAYFGEELLDEDFF